VSGLQKQNDSRIDETLPPSLPPALLVGAHGPREGSQGGLTSNVGPAFKVNKGVDVGGGESVGQGGEDWREGGRERGREGGLH
jgi:hypothetical protein